MSGEKKTPVYMEKESLGKRISDRRYIPYLLRELSGLFLVIYGIAYLFQFQALAAGRAAYDAFVATMTSPPMIALSVVIMGFSVYHTLTWLQLNAWLARNKWTDLNDSPRRRVFLGTIAVWIVASLVIAYLIFMR